MALLYDQQVEETQRFLHILGVSQVGQIDGLKGEQTDSGFAIYARQNDLDDRNITTAILHAHAFGQVSERINQLDAQTQSTTPQIFNPQVKELQGILQQLGLYEGRLDGGRGAGTDAALQAFNDHFTTHHEAPELPADDVMVASSGTAPLRLQETFNSVEPGDLELTRDEVYMIQGVLLDRGHPEVGALDGVMGRKTSAALENYISTLPAAVKESLQDADGGYSPQAFLAYIQEYEFDLYDRQEKRLAFKNGGGEEALQTQLAGLGIEGHAGCSAIEQFALLDGGLASYKTVTAFDVYTRLQDLQEQDPQRLRDISYFAQEENVAALQGVLSDLQHRDAADPLTIDGLLGSETYQALQARIPNAEDIINGGVVDLAGYLQSGNNQVFIDQMVIQKQYDLGSERRPRVQETVRLMAGLTDVPAEFMYAVWCGESGMGKFRSNNESSASGDWQIVRSTFKGLMNLHGDEIADNLRNMSEQEEDLTLSREYANLASIMERREEFSDQSIMQLRHNPIISTIAAVYYNADNARGANLTFDERNWGQIYAQYHAGPGAYRDLIGTLYNDPNAMKEIDSQLGNQRFFRDILNESFPGLFDNATYPYANVTGADILSAYQKHIDGCSATATNELARWRKQERDIIQAQTQDEPTNVDVSHNTSPRPVVSAGPV